jgi:endonuclease/exonuclease/phosphatase (EEP) superfamily protein YafD
LPAKPSYVRAADIVALLAGAVCLAGALGAQVGRFHPRVDLLANFAPFWLAGGVLVTGYGLIGARGKWRLWLGAIGIAAAAAAAVLILPELTRPTPPPGAGKPVEQITLIQFNAWGHLRAPEAAAAWLAGRQPDIIVMEDADPPIKLALIRYGFNVTRGISNTAIFSRAPRTLRTPMVPPQFWPLLPSFSRASFASPTGDFTVVAVHLMRPNEPEQILRAQALAQLISHFNKRRMILAGDFNLTPWSFGLRSLDAEFGLQRRDRALFSWPAVMLHLGGLTAPFPFLPIDHVYAGPAWRTDKIELGPNLGSDHYPVVATLTLTE